MSDHEPHSFDPSNFHEVDSHNITDYCQKANVAAGVAIARYSHHCRQRFYIFDYVISVVLVVSAFATAVFISTVYHAKKVKKSSHYDPFDDYHDEVEPWIEDLNPGCDIDLPYEGDDPPQGQGNSLMDMYEVMPPQLETFSRRQFGSRSHFGVISEEDEDTAREMEQYNSIAKNSLGSNNFLGTGPGRNSATSLYHHLRVPSMTPHMGDDHISAYRTNSQELVEQISRFLFTSDDVFGGKEKDEVDFKERRRSSSGSMSKKLTRKVSKPDFVLENLSRKRDSSVEVSPTSTNSPSPFPRRDSNSTMRLKSSLAVPLQAMNILRSPKISKAMTAEASTSVLNEEQKQYKSLKSLGDQPNSSESLDRFRMRGRHVQRMLAAFGHGRRSKDEADLKRTLPSLPEVVVSGPQTHDPQAKLPGDDDIIVFPSITETKSKFLQNADKGPTESLLPIITVSPHEDTPNTRLTPDTSSMK